MNTQFCIECENKAIEIERLREQIETLEPQRWFSEYPLIGDMWVKASDYESLRAELAGYKDENAEAVRTIQKVRAELAEATKERDKWAGELLETRAQLERVREAVWAEAISGSQAQAILRRIQGGE